MNAVLCILSELLVRRRQIRGRRWIWSSSFNSCRKVRHRELKWFTREYQWQSLKIENQFSSITQSCPTLCDPTDYSTPGLSGHHQLPEFTQTMSFESVMPSNHLILCYPLLLLPLIFCIIRVFSNESVLCIRWPKYWSFSFSISPSNEYSGLIFFRID